VKKVFHFWLTRACNLGLNVLIVIITAVSGRVWNVGIVVEELSGFTEEYLMEIQTLTLTHG
jgi:hypothetical protein